MVNKKGFIKVIEAFISVLFLLGIVLLIIQTNDIRQSDKGYVENRQTEILRQIQMNNSLREKIILETDFSLNSSDERFIDELKPYVDKTITNSNCYLKICPVNDFCFFESEKELYAKEILISSSLDIYSPRKLKIFCEK